MLVMKAWLETRWRLASLFAYCFIVMALNYQNRNPSPGKVQIVLLLLWIVLSSFVMTLAGAGVKSQAPVGFPEGLAESTQFTLSLPVTRLRLLAVPTAVGLLETAAATVIIGCMTWGMFPAVRAGTTLADFARIALTTLLWLTLPYCTALFFVTLLAEPLSFMCAG